jgi:uncharacterized protein YdaU (DUF1376 family)
VNYFDRITYEPDTGLFRWAVSGRGIQKGAIAGSNATDGYKQVRVGFKTYRAHRLAWFLTHHAWPDGEIDHINGDRADNRLCNLRVVARATNMQNQRRAHNDNHSCGLLGVTWNKQHKRWQSKLQVNKKMHHVGYFETAESAHAAYVALKRSLSSTCSI